jgi:predicted amidophosphoribosyltransferase
MNKNSNKTFEYSNKVFKVGDKVKHNGDEWIIDDITTTGDMTFFMMSAPGMNNRKFDAVRVANNNVNESLINIVKEELLNEVTYHKFKNEVKFRTKSEILHKAIREVKRKLSEIDRIVEYTSRMKQELSEGEEGLKYWKKTESNIATISEMVNQLNNKIKNLH